MIERGQTFNRVTNSKEKMPFFKLQNKKKFVSVLSICFWVLSLTDVQTEKNTIDLLRTLATKAPHETCRSQPGILGSRTNPNGMATIFWARFLKFPRIFLWSTGKKAKLAFNENKISCVKYNWTRFPSGKSFWGERKREKSSFASVSPPPFSRHDSRRFRSTDSQMQAKHAFKSACKYFDSYRKVDDSSRKKAVILG